MIINRKRTDRLKSRIRRKGISISRNRQNMGKKSKSPFKRRNRPVWMRNRMQKKNSKIKNRTPWISWMSRPTKARKTSDCTGNKSMKIRWNLTKTRATPNKRSNSNRKRNSSLNAKPKAKPKQQRQTRTQRTI
jgi:hypothetical protein